MGAKRKAAHGPLTLLFARVEGTHQIADALEPRALHTLLAELVRAWENAVGPTGGSFAWWDANAFGGTTALLAWQVDSEGPGFDLRPVATSVLAATREILDRRIPKDGPRGRVILAGVRGPALYEREGSRIVTVLGETLNAAMRLSMEPGTADEIRFGPGFSPGA